MGLSEAEYRQLLANQRAAKSSSKAPEPIVLPKAKCVQKHTPGVANKTETRYLQHLELRRIAGEILWYSFEAITLKLAHDCRYTADVAVMLKDCTLELHEVKTMTKSGRLLIADDANVKLKMAAELFPFVFRRMAYEPNTGEWIEKEIGRKAA